MRPSFWSESAESEHCFIEVYHLGNRFTHMFHERVHAMEERERAVIRLSKVYLSLSSFDVFKPNFVLQINAPDGWWRYLLFTKSPMEHLRSLSQWQVSGFLQSGWRNQVANVLLCELRTIWRTNIKSVMICSNTNLDKFNHSCYAVSYTHLTLPTNREV